MLDLRLSHGPSCLSLSRLTRRARAGLTGCQRKDGAGTSMGFVPTEGIAVMKLGKFGEAWESLGLENLYGGIL